MNKWATKNPKIWFSNFCLIDVPHYAQTKKTEWISSQCHQVCLIEAFLSCLSYTHIFDYFLADNWNYGKPMGLGVCVDFLRWNQIKIKSKLSTLVVMVSFLVTCVGVFWFSQ